MNPDSSDHAHEVLIEQYKGYLFFQGLHLLLPLQLECRRNNANLIKIYSLTLCQKCQPSNHHRGYCTTKDHHCSCCVNTIKILLASRSSLMQWRDTIPALAYPQISSFTERHPGLCVLASLLLDLCFRLALSRK
jgi:hypothetical protein